MRNESAGDLASGNRHGSDAWRVHQTDSVGQYRTRHEDVHHGDTLRVARVAGLRDIAVEIGWINVLGPAVGVANHRLGLRAVSKDRDRRCHRHDAHRQHVLANKRVQQRRLAALELTEAGDEELFGFEAFGKRSRLSRHILRARRIGQRRDPTTPFSIDGGNCQVCGSSRVTDVRVRRTSRSGPLPA